MSIFGQSGCNSIAIGKSGHNLDLAGRLRTSEKETVYTFTAQSMKNHTVLEKTAGSGSSTFNYDCSCVEMDVTTASGDKVTRQSFYYCPYLAGSPVLFKGTGVFASTKANVAQRIGMFDDAGGLFFEDNGTNMGVVRRTSTSGSPVNNRVAQSSWNIDKLDGTGPSGITISDWGNRLYLFAIEYLWQGAIGVTWGLISYDNGFIPVHKYDAFGSGAVPFIGKPSLPVRYEIENTGTAASATQMKMVCVDVVAEGGHRQTGSDWAFSNDGAAVNVGTSEEVVLVARLKNSFGSEAVRRILKLLEVNVLSSDQNAHFRVAIIHAPTSVTGGAWVDMDATHSAIEYNLGQPTISGGDNHTITEFTIPANNRGSGQTTSQSRFEDTHSLCVQSIDSDNSDLIVIYARALTSTTDVIASMKILEFE